MNLINKFVSVVLSWMIIVSTFPVRIVGQDVSSEKIPVAILDLEGRGISALEAATLTDRLRSEMVDVGVFMVVERGQMEMILEEQGFQQTGCTSAECAVEVGKLLGVEKMISGSIGKLGTLFTLDVRMFDVSTGEIERVSKREHSGSVEGLLKLLEVVANDMAGKKEEPEKEVITEVVEESEEVTEPKKKGKFKSFLISTIFVAALGGGGYYYWLTQQEEELPDLDIPPQPPTNP